MKLKKEFIELCKTSDLLIKKYQANSYISIIPSLHILREHPADLIKYKFVIANQRIKIIFYLIKSFFFYLREAFKNYFKKKYDYININNNKHKEYSNIFISHFINLNHCKTKDDFYFKDMPLISSKSVNTLVVLINHTSLDVSNHLEKFTRNNYDILVLSNNLRYKDKIHIFINSLKIFFIIFNDVLFNLRNFKQIIMLNALSNIFSDNTQLCFRFFTQINKILFKYQPNNIFFTYEGYAWEKALCMAVREYSNTARCIGYQHARLFKYQHSIKRKLKNKLDPHIILTSGKFAYQEFQRKLKGISIINIGKWQSQENKNIRFSKFNYFSIDSKIYVCVLPEGTIGECSKLLKFSLSCALQYKNIFFIWHFHPITDFKLLNKKINIKDNIPENIIISKQSLDKDLKISHMALYRGSTAILSAMQAGIIPVYFKIKNEFDINILEKNYEWSIKTESPINFFKQIQKLTMSKEKLLRSQKSAMVYSNNYFTNFNEKKFQSLFCKM